MNFPREAIQHAEQAYPEEACGVLLESGEYRACRNVADDPTRSFVLHPEDYRAALEAGEIAAIFHSHPDAPATPSDADRAVCEEGGYPWLILEVREGKAAGRELLAPSGWVAPLLGRTFAHGVHDCLAIILDYYRRERGVDLGNYDRRDNWWHEGGNLYLEHLPAAGFYRLPEGTQPETGDVVLMQVRSPVPNHAGVFLADGTLTSEPVPHAVPGCILHHMYGRLSRRDVYGGYYRDVTVGIWRYGKPTP